MERVKAGDLPAVRAGLLVDQGGKCKLCSEPVLLSEAVCDHDHTTGEIRGVLHRGCNAMLGHLENNRPRHKLNDVRRFSRFLANVIPYLAYNLGQRVGLLYPTHKTDDEKRIARNKKARKARAAAKEKV